MVALAARIARVLEAPWDRPGATARDHLGTAALLLQHGEAARARACLEAAAEAGLGAETPALWRTLGGLQRRAGDLAAAARTWRRWLAEGADFDAHPFEALAKVEEHRRRDFRGAAIVTDALAPPPSHHTRRASVGGPAAKRLTVVPRRAAVGSAHAHREEIRGSSAGGYASARHLAALDRDSGETARAGEIGGQGARTSGSFSVLHRRRLGDRPRGHRGRPPHRRRGHPRGRSRNESDARRRDPKAARRVTRPLRECRARRARRRCAASSSTCSTRRTTGDISPPARALTRQRPDAFAPGRSSKRILQAADRGLRGHAQDRWGYRVFAGSSTRAGRDPVTPHSRHRPRRPRLTQI
jgi:hypothetical protein